MADTLIGDSDLTFGITETGTIGYFESLEYDASVEILEVVDGDGDIVSVDFYGKKIAVSGTFAYTANSDANDPADKIGTGTTITIGQSPVGDGFSSASTIYVTKVRQSFSNTDVLKVEFEGMYWPNLAS